MILFRNIVNEILWFNITMDDFIAVQIIKTIYDISDPIKYKFKSKCAV